MRSWTPLDQWLASLYRADVLKEAPFAKVLRMARRVFRADQEMRAQAERMLRDLQPVVQRREKGGTAHIEKKKVEYLKMLLEKEKA